MNIYGLTKLELPAVVFGQKLLNEFTNHALGKNELTRITQAEDLAKMWNANGIPAQYFPCVPKYRDYWYLVQLLGMNRHIDSKGGVCKWNLDQNIRVWVENFPECDFDNKQAKFPNNGLWERLTGKSGLNLARTTTRYNVDELINTHSSEVLTDLGMNQENFEIKPISYEIYLRTAKEMGWGKHKLYNHFDGYRLRKDGRKMGLMGGYQDYGGARFIDSWWQNVINKAAVVRLMIVERL
jgi:hypothetical protein